MIKTIKLLTLCVLVASCKMGNHPDYEANTAIAQKYFELHQAENPEAMFCLLYTSPSPRDGQISRMPSSA